MEKQESMVLQKCECGCSMFVAEKTVWEDGDISYNLTIQDSRYDHNYTTFWGRLKSALTILFGKKVYYSDVYIGKPEVYKNLVDRMKELCME